MESIKILVKHGLIIPLLIIMAFWSASQVTTTLLGPILLAASGLLLVLIGADLWRKNEEEHHGVRYSPCACSGTTHPDSWEARMAAGCCGKAGCS